MTASEQRQILHLDMDAFFASVEQRDFPELRGKALVVGGRSERGVVAAASYEARKYGIHSAMPMVQALRRCPDLVVQPGRMAVYQAVSREVFAIFHRYTDLVEKLSVDEAFLDVSGSLRLFGPARHITAEIRQAVHVELGLTVSAGIAPNKFLAKLASDAGKPDGVFEILPDGIDDFLLPLPVGRLWGVGPKAANRLHQRGIQTVADLRTCEVAWLERNFGVWGPRLYELCRGIDQRPVVPGTEVQSVGHEETFDTDLRDRSDIERELLLLCERVALRCRKKEVRGRTITLKVRYDSFDTCTRSQTLPQSTDHAMTIFGQVVNLLRKTEVGSRPVRLLGVTVSNLGEETQGQLFASVGDDQNRRLDRAVDQVRERFGTQGLVRGTLLGRDKKP